MKKAVPVEVHNKDGKLDRIEFYDMEGAHIIDALWDEHDEQTPINRIEFRKWANTMLERKGYTINQ